MVASQSFKKMWKKTNKWIKTSDKDHEMEKKNVQTMELGAEKGKAKMKSFQ